MVLLLFCCVLYKKKGYYKLVVRDNEVEYEDANERSAGLMMEPDDLSDLHLELRLILRRSNRTPRGGGGLSISELSRLLSRKGHDALRSAGATLRQFIAEEKVTFKDTNEKY